MPLVSLVRQSQYAGLNGKGGWDSMNLGLLFEARGVLFFYWRCIMSEPVEIIKTKKHLPNWTNWVGIALLIVLAVSGAVFSQLRVETSVAPVCCGSH